MQCNLEVYPESPTYILVIYGTFCEKMNNIHLLITKEVAILREGGSIICF